MKLVARAARSAPPSTSASSAPVDPGAPLSILSLAATSYGSRPTEDMTIPTGFDPAAVVLFEAIIEGAYLVATADGHFDGEERRAFEHLVVEACGGTVSSQQITALVADLGSQLRSEGLARRIESVATGVSKREHALEVLRVAALIAETSEGTSAVERDVLAKLAAGCGLDAHEVDAAMAKARSALQQAG